MELKPADQASAQAPVRKDPGPGETLEGLFADLESPLLGYALRLAGEREVAEDIVQEAFMKLQGQFNEVREPRRWLYRTVHNLALNHRRRAGKLIPLDLPVTGEGQASLEATDPQPLPDEQIARW